MRDAERLSKYLVKSFGSDALPRPREMKGAKLVRYSHGIKRRANQQFGWNGRKSQLGRRQVARVAAALGVREGEFKNLYGRHWHYRFQQMVECLNYDHKEADGEPVWSDVEIAKAAEIYLVRNDEIRASG